LFRRLLSEPEFRNAEIDTGYLDRLLTAGKKAEPPNEDLMRVAAIAAVMLNGNNGATTAAPVAQQSFSSNGKWKRVARQEQLR
jgi:acetyl-CoA carboxylase biotin carboxylase subunit